MANSESNIVKIRVGKDAFDCSVTLNGDPIQGLTRLSFVIDANSPTLVHLTVLAEIEVEGEFGEETALEVRRPNPGTLPAA